MDEVTQNYSDMKFLLTRPSSIFPVSSLEGVLALICGVFYLRYPRDSEPLPGFAELVGRRFGNPATDHNVTLLRVFGHLPLSEACNAVLKLLEEWKFNRDASKIPPSIS
jgi:hypothetical protein